MTLPAEGKIIIETARLTLREVGENDAAFILELVNDPDWLRYIGDKNVRSLDDARRYIAEGPVAMYMRCGHGLWRVELKDSGTPIGLCGLIKRDTLPDVDIGFAFAPAFRGKGYAVEAAAATLDHGHKVLNLPRIVAITSPDNDASAKLLNRIGLRFEQSTRLTADGGPVSLFGTDFKTLFA